MEGQISWPEVIQYLIEKGHQLEAIKDYTLYQLRTFYQTGVKMDNERAKNSFALNSISSSGNADLIKDTVKTMSADKRLEEFEKIKDNLKSRKKF